MLFVLFLHVGAAIFTIGPLTVVTSLSPRYIRAGAEELPVLRFLHRVTRYYGLASLLVLALGAALVRDKIKWGQFWVSSSITLFVVALGLLFAIVDRDQVESISRLESGEPATAKATRIQGVSAAISLIWLVILVMMFYKPGK
jgi:hypothetical protein